MMLALSMAEPIGHLRQMMFVNGQGVSPGAGEQQGTSVHDITNDRFDHTFDSGTASASDSASHQLHSSATHTHTDVDKGGGAETKIQESRVGEKEDTNLRSISESTNSTKRDNQLATNRDREKEWEADMSMQSRVLHSCEASTLPPPPSQGSRGCVFKTHYRVCSRK